MKVTLNLGNRTVEAEKMAFNTVEESWSVYKLEDGTVVKVKPVVSDIFKLDINDPVTGLPQVLVRAASVVSVQPTETPLSKREVH